MSTGSIGVEGHADDQTLGSMDAPAIVNLTGVAYTGNQRFPASPVDVSGFEAVAGFANVSGTTCILNWDYYLYPSAANFLGSRALILDPNVVQAAQFRIPNLGPYVSFHYLVATGTTNFTPTLYCYPTNRIAGLDFPVPSDILQAWSGVAVGAGASFTRWWLQYYAGPARLWIVSDQAGCTYALNCQQQSGVVEQFDGGTIPTGTPSSVPILSPARACNIVVTNGGAATAHVNGAIMASVTGSL